MINKNIFQPSFSIFNFQFHYTKCVVAVFNSTKSRILRLTFLRKNFAEDKERVFFRARGVLDIHKRSKKYERRSITQNSKAKITRLILLLT